LFIFQPYFKNEKLFSKIFQLFLEDKKIMLIFAVRKVWNNFFRLSQAHTRELK